MSLAGIVLITRHGDRQGFYQSPTTYTASDTSLTVLGYLQEYKNGADLRSMYLTDNAIAGLNTTVANSEQIDVIADAGGEGTVIVDSANALLQGLYPPYNETIVLANSSTISWDRAQLIQIETIEAEQQVWLEGWTSCNTWTQRLNAWYQSPAFQAQAKIANPFFESLSSVLGDRPATLQNAWNLFDYLNVESIHNASVAVTPEELSQARQWADYHEAGSFSDPDPSNIGNIAGQAILPPVLSSINGIANSTSGLKLSYLAISYKPFMSLFSMWGLPSPLNSTVVDYASAVVLEIRTNNTMRLLFRDGVEGDFAAHALFGSADSESYPIDDFMSRMEPYSLPDLSSWCNACGTTDARGCATLAALNGTGGAGYASATSTQGRHAVSPIVAGLIGAFVALAVAAAVLALWLLLGGMARKRQRSSRDDLSVETRTGSERHLDGKGASD